MLTYTEAQKILVSQGQLSNEKSQSVSLFDAHLKVLSQEVKSPHCSPPFSSAAMDGFAVNSAACQSASPDNPVILKVVGTTRAGASPFLEPTDPLTSALEIMTGAPLEVSERQGWDAVVKVEDVRVDQSTKGAQIKIHEPVERGANIRLRGSDFNKDQLVFSAGTLLTPARLSVLASLGLAQIPVRNFRVLLFATGDELVPPGQPLTSPFQIFHSSGYFLKPALESLGVTCQWGGIVPDSAEKFCELVSSHLESSSTAPDLILTTGAVSRGRYDFLPDALQRLRAQILFHKVAIRPGKPILFAKLAGGPYFFGLPGNPIATMVGCRFFVMPFLQSALRLPAERILGGQIEGPLKGRSGLDCFFLARQKPKSHGSCFEALESQSSYQLNPLRLAQGWVHWAEGATQFFPFLPLYD